MSLPKKDAHIYLEHDWHEVMSCLADSEGVTLTEWIARAAMEKADREARRASLVAARLEQSGAARIIKERRGE